jgi:hypothetical protein
VSGNAQPQFTAQGDIASCLLTTAFTTSDGSTGSIGTAILILFTAGSNGSYVEFVRVIPVASSASTAAAATCIRIFVSSISTGSCSTTNTFLVAELAIPALTADSPTAATNWFDIPLGFRLPAGWTLLAATGTAANANTGYRCTAFGGDY